MQTNEDLIVSSSMIEFRKWLAGKGLSKNSLLSCNLRVESFLSYGNKRNDFELLSERALLGFLNQMRANGSSPTTIRLTKEALSYLFEFAGVPYPEPAQLVKEDTNACLSPEETRSFIKALEWSGSVKARLIASLCFYADFSPRAIVDLNHEDVILEAPRCFIFSQQNGTFPELVGHAGKLMQSHYESPAKPQKTLHRPLFTNDQGYRLTKSGVDYLVKTVGVPVHLVLCSSLLRRSGREFVDSSGYLDDTLFSCF